jgi:arylsulfatase A-like enzyme
MGIWHLHHSYVEGRNRRFLWSFSTYTTPVLKEEAENFYGNLAPTRFVCYRKKQKIYPENWYLHNSYDERRSRRFIRKIGTYTIRMMKEEAEDLSGKLVPTQFV